jgi:hypothetical protein
MRPVQFAAIEDELLAREIRAFHADCVKLTWPPDFRPRPQA